MSSWMHARRLVALGYGDPRWERWGERVGYVLGVMWRWLRFGR